LSRYRILAERNGKGQTGRGLSGRGPNGQGRLVRVRAVRHLGGRVGLDRAQDDRIQDDRALRGLSAARAGWRGLSPPAAESRGQAGRDPAASLIISPASLRDARTAQVQRADRGPGPAPDPVHLDPTRHGPKEHPNPARPNPVHRVRGVSPSRRQDAGRPRLVPGGSPNPALAARPDLGASQGLEASPDHRPRAARAPAGSAPDRPAASAGLRTYPRIAFVAPLSRAAVVRDSRPAQAAGTAGLETRRFYLRIGSQSLRVGFLRSKHSFGRCIAG